MQGEQDRLIIVSNRLPIVINQDEQGDWEVQPGSGGLVTALAPVLGNRGGVWIGWPGRPLDEDGELRRVLSEETGHFGYSLKPVNLTQEETEKYYEGFANEILWPLFHDLAAYCRFDPEYWKVYQKVNLKFAKAITQHLNSNDFVWVHDYHLMTVAQELRQLDVKSQVAFFLHTPFPPLDIFIRLPWRFEILKSLLAYDVLGFQTLRDRRNFINCVRRLIPAIRRSGRGQTVTLKYENREIRVGAFPISIDYKDFSKSAKKKEVARNVDVLQSDMAQEQIILGVDRLDYSKGIVERLKGFRNALRRFPELRKNSTMVQVVVPSRKQIPQYASLKVEIEGLVGQINGEFTRSGWAPVHYQFRSLERDELLAYYRMSDTALITSLKDGMNLIAKEYCAANVDENGALILSEFAGAAAQFQKHALMVNPHDVEDIADAIYQAYRMQPKERKNRMRKLRRAVRRQDIFWWVESFLNAAFAKHLDDFPVLQDYVPQEFAE